METAVDGRVGGELCSGGHTSEYGGGWVRSYSDRVRTRTGGGRVLTSCVGGSRDGVGAGVGVLLAGAFRRLGLPPKGANIVVAESDISMPPEQRGFRGIIGKQSSSELQIREGPFLSDRAGRSSPMQCNMYAQQKSGTQPTPGRY